MCLSQGAAFRVLGREEVRGTLTDVYIHILVSTPYSMSMKFEWQGQESVHLRGAA